MNSASIILTSILLFVYGICASDALLRNIVRTWGNMSDANIEDSIPKLIIQNAEESNTSIQEIFRFPQVRFSYYFFV